MNLTPEETAVRDALATNVTLLTGSNPDSKVGLSLFNARLVLAALDRLDARINEYEHAISWDTTCLNCSKLLDASYKETMRAEKAEAEVSRLDAEDDALRSDVETTRRAFNTVKAERDAALAENTALRAENATIQRVWDTAFDRGVEAGANDAERDAALAVLEQVKAQLTYISCPTMGLPGGADPAKFAMEGADEWNARYALSLCIQTARLALAALSSASQRETL